MAAASDFQLQTVFFPAENGGLNMGFVHGGDDDNWFWCCRSCESEISNVSF